MSKKRKKSVPVMQPKQEKKMVINMNDRLQNRQIYDGKRQTKEERLEKRIRKRQRIRKVW